MKTLVVGLGNPILGDDGVGWKVAEEVRREMEIGELENNSPILQSSIVVDCFALGGLSLMERLIGYDRAILVDAVARGGQPGAVTCTRLDELPDRSTAHTTAVHDTSLQNAIRVGRQMGAHLPETIWVVGIEAEPVYEFSEELTPAVSAAAPRAVQLVLSLLEERECFYDLT